jgi:hypothetical protein
MKTMQSKFFMISIVAVSIFYLQQLQTFANSVTVGNYTLTVSKGSPAYSPEAPTTTKIARVGNQLVFKRLIQLYFSLKIEKRTARGVEDVSDDVKSCSYEISLSTGAFFYRAIPFNLSTVQTVGSYTIQNQDFYSNVTHIIGASTVGNKALLMRVTVTMKDGTTLTAFASNSFEVCEYVITVYSYVGDINKRLVSNGYLYDIGSMTTDYLLKETIGHATWQVEVNDPKKLSSTTKWTKYVNIPCGYSITSSEKNTLGANLRYYPSGGLAVIAKGDLIRYDRTGGVNKQFKMTKVQAESSLDKTLDIDTTKPIYDLHSNNCVDTSMAVAKAGGVTFKTTCRHKVEIKNGSDTRTADISLPSELANELK